MPTQRHSNQTCRETDFLRRASMRRLNDTIAMRGRCCSKESYDSHRKGKEQPHTAQGDQKCVDLKNS